MAEQTTQKQTAFSFDEKAWKNQVDKLSETKAKFAGASNYNPFLWWGVNVQPLLNRYNKGERTKELQDALSSVKDPSPISGK